MPGFMNFFSEEYLRVPIPNFKLWLEIKFRSCRRACCNNDNCNEYSVEELEKLSPAAAARLNPSALDVISTIPTILTTSSISTTTEFSSKLF